MKDSILLSIALFLISTTPILAQTPSQKIDSIAFLTEVIRVSDSIRDSGEYLEAVTYLRKGLEFYDDGERTYHFSFDQPDTLISDSKSLPDELIRSDTRRIRGKSVNKEGLQKVYYKKDYTLFNGYVIHIINKHQQFIDVYSEGLVVATRVFRVFRSNQPPSSNFPFPQLDSVYVKPMHDWNETIILKDKGKLKLSSEQDTLEIETEYYHYNKMEVRFTPEKDIYSISISLDIGNDEHVRRYELKDEDPGEFYYEEALNSPDKTYELTLNHLGDTINLDSYKHGKKHGVRVESEDYPNNENYGFFVLWENNAIVDVLNTNLLYMNKNAKLISKEEFMEKSGIVGGSYDPFYIRSNEMVRVDEFGKTWIVIPYKVENFERFKKKLNRTKWKPRFPD